MASEESIRELCARVVAADEADLQPALAALHAALKAHVENLRGMAAAALVNPIPPSTLPEA